MKFHWCGRKPDDPQPIVYHGCYYATDMRILQAAGINEFCFSYYWKRCWKGFKQNINKLTRAFLDSGAFTFNSALLKGKQSRADVERQVEEYAAKYAEWIKEAHFPFDFHVTLDYVAEAPTVRRMTRLLRQMGIQPTPVYHGDSGLDTIKRYYDQGCRFIAISRMLYTLKVPRRRYYEKVFEVTEKLGMNCHGFACTGSEIHDFPWVSVDSTSLIRNRGEIFFPSKGEGLSTVQTSKRHNGAGECLKEYVQSMGFDFAELQRSREQRLLYNAKVLTRFIKSKNGNAWKERSLL